MAFPRPAIGVGAILLDGKNRVLLIRRGQPPALGRWSVPGGRLEPGETLAQACRREVLEETGLEIELGPIIAVVERIQEGFHYVILDFIAALRQPDRSIPCAASDVSEARWVPLTQLSDYPLVEGLAAVIEKARQSKQAKTPLGLMDRDGQGRDFLPSSD